jgi:uncharacterized membrane protein YdbT with pleckstrin-like domain
MPTDDTFTQPAGPEITLWKGHSSQWLHAWFYLLCLLLTVGIIVAAVMTAGLALVGLVVPLIMALIRWWLTKTTSFELTSQRLKIDSGILNRRHEELELYRVKDYSLERPFLLRIVGLGNLIMHTSDTSTPIVTIRAIAEVQDVREKLRAAVQTERDRKRVRELDVDGGSAALG